MSNRNYNVFFNTHTISGIVICVALYIIFFAGAFSLFKDEIDIWEEGKTLTYSERHDIDYDRILNYLDEKHELTGRDLQLNFGGESDKIYAFISTSKDSLASEKAKESLYFSIDINSLETKTYEAYYGLGEFLYRLHFFAQFPYIGVYLAGFVSLFFLFAIVTGVIVHWKKIIPNFYKFNPKVALKRVWTDAHTALGVLGLPFQFMFAVTGAYFCLSLLVLLPANFLYNGDQNKLMEDLRPERKTYEWIATSNDEIPSFNQFTKRTASHWDNFHLTRGFIKNYGGTNMKFVINGELKTSERFIGVGSITYDANTGVIESEKNPNNVSYVEDSQFVYGRLHFADFGGFTMKIIYFILTLITCFVIITGVLIWIEARNKKSMTISQRLYTAKVGHIYLAICLSMLPVTALAFLFVKITNGSFTDKQSAIYWFYFITWFVFILFFRFKRDNYFINKYSLLLGAIFGFFIPIVNGVVSGNWIWTMFSQHQFDILFIDVLWIVIATISLISYLKIKPEIKDNSAFAKNPIDYKNLTALKAEEAKELRTIPAETKVLILKQTNGNHITMKTKIIILWLFLGLGWVIHHLYGLMNIYYKEILMMEGATGEVPIDHHMYRILFEGFCLFFALLTIEVSKQWFKWASLVWAIIAGLYNVYHFITAIIYESSNVSEIFMLALVAIASVLLIKNLFKWKNNTI